MFERIAKLIHDRDTQPKIRIFRLSVLVAAFLGAAGLIESFALTGFKGGVFMLLAVMAGLIATVSVTFRLNKVNVVANVMGVILIMLIFPGLFILNGGVDGGAPIWFVLGIFYIFLMYTGKPAVILFVLTMITYIILYGIGYHFPDRLSYLDSRAAVYTDSLFSVLAVGIALGILSKFQLNIYDEERKINKEQQEELKRVNSSQNNFFAGMSHEIRTPINTIIGLNEMIMRENQDEKTKEYAAHIQVASKMLLSLVNDILDLSRMEMQKMEIFTDSYDTRRMLQELVDMIQIRTMEKSLKFFVEVDSNLPSQLLGDERRIKQILLNLLTNAVKYTKEGSVTLIVNWDDSAPDKPLLRVSVADTGIGIRKENIQYLYDVFKRFDEKSNTKIEGSGLGLAISKQLLDLMDGEISVDSIYMKGSTFTVVIPQQVANPLPIGDESFLENSHKVTYETYRQTFEAPEAKILVVDDNEMNAMVVSKLLGATKVQVDCVTSGVECLEKTQKQYYNVILMDYMMPEMNGAETVQLLREQVNGLCKDSAVIVLTADTLSEARALCQDYDFDSYLEKPIQGIQLEEEILRFLPEDIVEYRKEKVVVSDEDERDVSVVRGHKKRKICITTDCISDIPEELIEKYGIQMMYLYIKTENARFADTREINSDNLAEFYGPNGKITAVSDSASVGEYEAFFADVLTHAEDVVHIALTSKIGKSYGMAVEAAKSFDHVHIIDSEQISCGAGLVTLQAARLAMEGRSVGEIVENVNKTKRQVVTRFLLPSMEAMYRGGYTDLRISRFCELFNLHPILEMRRGKMHLQGFGLGDVERWWKFFIRRHIFPIKMVNDTIVSISHVGCSVRQQEIFRTEVNRRIHFKQTLVNKAAFSNACNAGIGSLGISYFRKYSGLS